MSSHGSSSDGYEDIDNSNLPLKEKFATKDNYADKAFTLIGWSANQIAYGFIVPTFSFWKAAVGMGWRITLAAATPVLGVLTGRCCQRPKRVSRNVTANSYEEGSLADSIGETNVTTTGGGEANEGTLLTPRENVSKCSGVGYFIHEATVSATPFAGVALLVNLIDESLGWHEWKIPLITLSGLVFGVGAQIYRNGNNIAEKAVGYARSLLGYIAYPFMAPAFSVWEDASMGERIAMTVIPLVMGLLAHWRDTAFTQRHAAELKVIQDICRRIEDESSNIERGSISTSLLAEAKQQCTDKSLKSKSWGAVINQGAQAGGALIVNMLLLNLSVFKNRFGDWSAGITAFICVALSVAARACSNQDSTQHLAYNKHLKYLQEKIADSNVGVSSRRRSSSSSSLFVSGVNGEGNGDSKSGMLSGGESSDSDAHRILSSSSGSSSDGG